MVLTVHHLQRSQSERVPWLCEELGIPYELKNYARAPLLAPAEYKSLWPVGAAPIIDDVDPTTNKPIRLAESGAIAEYIIQKHGKGRLALTPDHPDYVDYLYWFHFSNGTLQPAVSRKMFMASMDESNPIRQTMKARMHGIFEMMDKRLKQTTWLAGEEFTAADVMNVFSLTTMRIFAPTDLSQYEGIAAYLKRVGAREAYKKAMEKGDPGFEPVLGTAAPPLFEGFETARKMAEAK